MATVKANYKETHGPRSELEHKDEIIAALNKDYENLVHSTAEHVAKLKDENKQLLDEIDVLQASESEHLNELESQDKQLETYRLLTDIIKILQRR